MEERFSMFQEAIKTYLPKLVLAIATLVIGWIVIGWIVKIFKKALGRSHLDSLVSNYLGSLASVFLKVLLFFSVAGTFGITTTSFVAILGAATLAIGMALQGSLNHFAAGVVLMLFKPYRIGDFIEVKGKSGTVKDIGIFTTQLTTENNNLVYMPNGEVLAGPITNFTILGVRQLVMTFRIRYEDDVDEAKEIITRLFRENELVLSDRPLRVVVSELGDSFVKLTANAWATSGNFWTVNFYMLENVKKEFSKAGIGIPYPKMSVQLDENAKQAEKEN